MLTNSIRKKDAICYFYISKRKLKMPLNITDSQDISSLDSKVIFDLCSGKILVDVTPSTWIGGGDAYVQGVKVKVVNPLGIAIKDYSSSFDISGDLNYDYEYTLPLVGNNYQYGNYTVYVKLVDSDGKEYEFSKEVNICPPNKENVSKKYGCLSAKMTAKCKAGKMIVILDAPPTYRGKLPNSQENDLELEYPTGSELDPLDVVLSNFSTSLFEGVYRLKGEVCVEYLMGDNVTIYVPYKVDCEKKVVCKLDECCVQSKLDELNERLKTDCTNEEREETSSIILQTLFLYQAAKGAQDCGLDPSGFIIDLENLLGCSCSCGCSGENAQIGETIPAADITFNGCGFEQETTGDTTNITIYNRQYELVSGSDNVTVGDLEIDEENCAVRQTITVENEPVNYCEDFSESAAQGNAIDGISGLGFIETEDDCTPVKIDPPTGFAVTGSTRKSFFGTMEWYDTLTNANAAANSGETVLIFNDTSENLVLKSGVNYTGIGLKQIGSVTLTGAVAYKGTLSNIKAGDLTMSANADEQSEVFLTNFISTGDGYFAGYVKVHGGVHLDNTKKINVVNNAYFGNYFSEKHVVYTNSAKGSSFKIRSTRTYSESIATDNLGALVITNPTDVVIYNADVEAANYTAIYSNTIPNNGSVQLTHSKGNALGTGHGIYFHSGGELTSSKSIFTHCIGRSFDGDGIQVTRAYEGEENSLTNTRFFITHNTGYSVNRYGIYSISSNLKLCTGYSENSNGIRFAGSDIAHVNCYLIQCVGESKNSGGGLYANRDIRIVGGTFQSGKDATDGNPIILTKNVVRPNEHYVVSGVTTIAVNTDPTCYAIKGDATVNLRASNNNFLNFFLDDNVAGIDPTIVLRNVNIDYYNNIS